LVAFATEFEGVRRYRAASRGKHMRQFLVSLALGMSLCGEAGAQSPTTVAELRDRWIELLSETDGDISAIAFEKAMGLELLVTMHGVDGAIGRSVQIVSLDGSSLLANVRTSPGRKSTSASLEWTPGYFAVLTGRSCIDSAELTEDLVAMGWKARSDPHQASTFSALFQRKDNLAAYGEAGESRGRRCRLYYQSHYFDPVRIDKSRPAPAEEPEGKLPRRIGHG
jgi:hypothetical protein